MSVIDERRIIGHCFEINSDIIMMERESKLPKFLAKMKANHYRNKLIKEVSIMKNINEDNGKPLHMDHIIELIVYLYNNYPPYGSYKDVLWVKNFDEDDFNSKQCKIVKDDIAYIIKAEPQIKTMHVEVRITNTDGSFSSFTFIGDRLETTNRIMEKYINNLNVIIINIIADYILDFLENYKKSKEK